MSWVWGLGVASLVAIGIIGAVRWLWRLGRAIQVERAWELFRLVRPRLEEELLAAGQSRGKPRHLQWARCQILGTPWLVRDRQRRCVVAVAAVEVAFEPLAGTDMADWPAARLPRYGTATFVLRRGQWDIHEPIRLNLSPQQLVEQLAGRYVVIGRPEEGEPSVVAAAHRTERPRRSEPDRQ